MRLGIMQPYFMPYIGYWQLMNAVDKYVVYDNIEYTKKGWFNRNRILLNGKDIYITIPIKSDSDFLNVDKRFLAKDFNRAKLLNQIRSAYLKAPFFERVYPLVENVVLYNEDNLFEYIFNSIKNTACFLGIETELIKSSLIDINHAEKGKNKVLSICKKMLATDYYNAIGGQSLYDKAEFNSNGIDLHFLQAEISSYNQFDNEFVSGLSIIDVMMFNSPEEIDVMLNKFTLI